MSSPSATFPTLNENDPFDTDEDTKKALFIEHAESRNLILLAIYQVLLRVAWIFKTESVVMPAFLHAIAGPAWVQGWLPLLNRTGQSVIPIFFADALRQASLKKRWLLFTTGMMALGFLSIVLGILWQVSLQPSDENTTANSGFPPLFVAAFLLVYFLFFIATGLNQLTLSTVQGKLISANRRGRLMGLGGIVGSFCAVLAVGGFLWSWAGETAADFVLPFSITAGVMVCAAILSITVIEPRDQYPGHHAGLHFLRRGQRAISESIESLGKDRNLRLLSFSGMLFITAQCLFPHYVTLAKQSPDFSGGDLVWYLVTQNIGAGLFSWWIGGIADRHGNRRALSFCLLVNAMVPLSAVLITSLVDARWMSCSFFLLGMTPVTIKVLSNYALELTEPEWHPRYVSTLRLALAAPVVMALPIAFLIGVFGHTPIFVIGSLVIGVGASLSLWLEEPRHGTV
ncbi:MFS transporter [Calycomorphotria hydatis]|uniref:Major Facilitator Superfamily protein n=1 Tax=Calycomorphotria hydatis TaxID=2528027 RepID=A0A517TC45_9PLAN|nr:MFS transporter [Calycomorphotria hydatis]QDT65947.1 Major Facilitator Superfamily protein [Calycomorphotria hydatis]